MSAWYLTEQGHQVTIVDRHHFGAACSHANCGYICPSHVLPLAAPGAIGGTLKTLFQRNSPFAIKKKFSPTLWKWFLQFARRCNHKDMMESARSIYPLLVSSRELYVELLSRPEFDCEWKQNGLLFVYDSVEEFEAYGKTNELIEKEFGSGAVPYDAKALVKLEPALKSGLGGAWHHEMDMHVRPDRLMSNLKQALLDRGVTIREQTEIKEIVGEASSALAIRSDQGDIEADHFVVATGAMTPFLQSQLGCRTPIQPGKGYTITMRAPDRAPKIPMIFEEHRVAVTPMDTGYRIGSTMEFAGYDTSINPKRLGLLRDAAKHYLHEPYTDDVSEEWFGWRPMTYDSRPIIDRSPRFKNTFIAAGHSMLGLTMGSGTGKLVAELVCDLKPHVDPKPFSVSRF